MNKVLKSKQSKQTYDPNVANVTVDYAEAVGLEAVHHALAKADHIHGASDGVRQGKDETYGAAELGPQ